MHGPDLIVKYVPEMLPYVEEKGATDLHIITDDVTPNRQMLIQYNFIGNKPRAIKSILIERLCDETKANEI